MAGASWSHSTETGEMTESMETGAEVIRAFVKTLPSAPGVYRMIDEAGEVMYVGKARSLKARVTNYTRPEGLEVRLQRMIAATRTMEFVRTEPEAEALLRDRLSALALVQSQGDVVARGIEEADVFAIAHEAGQFCVQVFFFRAHQNWGNYAYRPKADSSLTDTEVLE